MCGKHSIYSYSMPSAKRAIFDCFFNHRKWLFLQIKTYKYMVGIFICNKFQTDLYILDLQMQSQFMLETSVASIILLIASWNLFVMLSIIMWDMINLSFNENRRWSYCINNVNDETLYHKLYLKNECAYFFRRKSILLLMSQE